MQAKLKVMKKLNIITLVRLLESVQVVEFLENSGSYFSKSFDLRKRITRLLADWPK
jgi:hypothetical protein